MSHNKLPWIIAVVAAGAAVFSLVLMRKPTPVGAAAADPTMAARLARLEAQVPAMQNSLTQAGSQAAAAVLATAQPPPPPTETDPATAKQREAAAAAVREEKERRYYEQLDALARAGGRTAPDQLRKNIDTTLRAVAKAKSKAPAAVRSLDCSDDFCRVEFSGGVSVLDAAGSLVSGMGSLSMPPGPGRVFYVAAPGRELPAAEQ